MCLIIDANVAARFEKANDAACEFIREWVLSKNGRIAIGGKLTEELCRVKSFQRWMVSLQRAGLTIPINATAVEEQAKLLKTRRACKSNDHHVIAVAQLSGARVLFSEDENLHADFKNANLISQPRGSIFQNIAHKRIVENSNCRKDGC